MSIGLLVAGVVWLAVAPSGRPAGDLVRAHRWPRRRLWSVRGGAARGASVGLLVANVAALLRSGAAPGHAWVTAAGVRVDQQGVPDRDDLLVVVGARGSVEAPGQVAAVVAASRLAADVGAPLGTVLASIAQALAAEAEARADREASLAGPAATARVLLWLPVVGIVLGLALGVDPVTTALSGGVGSAGLVVGAALLLVGRRWSGRLVDRARTAGAAP